MNPVTVLVLLGCDAGEFPDHGSIIEPAPLVSSVDPSNDESRCAADDTICVDVRTMAPWLSVTAPWTLGALVPVSDLDDDGTNDLLVFLTTQDGSGREVTRLSVVLDPLQRERVLPDDEDGVLPAGVVIPRADLTGDGVADLLWQEGDPYTEPAWLMAGPWTGPLDSASAVGSVALGSMYTLGDYDGDGDLDYAVMGSGMAFAGRVEVWTGPSTTWSVTPPTTTYRFACSDGLGDPGTPMIRGMSDTDGDGRDEVVMYGSPPDPYNDCSSWILPGGLAGDVDVESSGLGIEALQLPIELGDQNGDGSFDFLVNGEVVSGPLTWSVPLPAEVAATGTLLYTPASSVPSVRWPLNVDLDGDGIGDWMTYALRGDPAAGVYEIYTGGPSGSITTGLALYRLIADVDSTMEIVQADGVAVAFSVHEGVARIVQLIPSGAADVELPIVR